MVHYPSSQNIGDILLVAITGGNENIPILHIHQHDDSVIFSLLSHTPLFADHGCQHGSGIASVVVQSNHEDLGGVPVLKFIEFLVQGTFFTTAEHSGIVVDPRFGLGRNRELVLSHAPQGKHDEQTNA